MPRILTDRGGLTTWFLELRRRCRRVTGRELGFAHATRALAHVIKSWQDLPLEGPDGYPVFLDLRIREGYLSDGFRNTTGHMAPLLELVRDRDVVLDIGANIGVWSRQVLSQRRLARLVAFEPEPRSHRLLQKNLAPYPAASCERLAVGDYCGTVSLSEGVESKQNYIANEVRPSARTHLVPIVTLDSWFAESMLDRLDVLKVDVEGFEYQVFRGAEQTIRRFRPLVYFEYVPSEGSSTARKSQAFEWLKGLGYRMRAVLLDGSTAEVVHAHDFDALAGFSCDVIARPEQQASLQHAVATDISES